MKQLSLTLVLLIAAVFTAAAQPLEQYGLDGYIGISGRASSVFSENAGYLDVSAGINIHENWVLGLTASGLIYDHQMNKLVDDGTYHMGLVYGGLFLEHLIPLTRHLQASLSLMTGQGLVNYRYDNEYRDDKVWHEEIIDQTTFGVQELCLGIRYHCVRPIPDRFDHGVPQQFPDRTHRHTGKPDQKRKRRTGSEIFIVI
ncbi:MAG: hypothetical protein U5R06_24595 [candidate division KSB1 bacterium]|nr:hypothetical protein [candidate division KSB1 bacterium]